jgi:hypothetical protein
MELSDTTDKIPSDTTGIDPGTFRLIAQCLNHYATPDPNFDNYNLEKKMPLEERTSWLECVKIILKRLLDLSGTGKPTASVEQ